MNNKGQSINRILFIIFFTVFLNLLGITIIIPVLAPLFLQGDAPNLLPANYSFGEITIILGLLKAAYPIMQFFGSPVLGAVSDRIGRKQVLIYSLIGSLIGYLIFAAGIVYSSIWLLFLGRIIDGITGGNIAVIYSSISDISNEQNKTKNFGLVGVAFGVGFVIGPLIGGVTSNPEIISWFDYSTPFLLAAGLVLINIFLVIRWFPETIRKKRKVKIRATDGIRNLIKAFHVTEYRNLLLVIFLAALGFSFFTQFFDVYLIEQFSYDQSDIGKLFGYVGIWIAVSQGGLNRWASRYFQSQSVLAVSLLGVGVFILLLLLPGDPSMLYFILPLVSLFQGLNQPNLLTLLSNRAGSDEQGEALGINQSLQSLSITIPPIIAGIIIAWDIRLPMIVASVSMATAWLIFVTTTMRSKK